MVDATDLYPYDIYIFWALVLAAHFAYFLTTRRRASPATQKDRQRRPMKNSQKD